MTSSAESPVATFALSAEGAVPELAVRALNQDGVVCIAAAFGSDWLTVIEAGIDQALSGASADVDVVKREGDNGSFSFSSGAWQSVEPFRRFIFESHLPDIALTLLDTSELALFYDFLLIKQARSDNASTPWHQDHSYYPLDGFKVVNSWLALDDIPLSSALRFLPGSHSSGTLHRAVDFNEPATPYRHARGRLPLPPDVNDDVGLLASPMKAGDLLVWKSYTLHSAPGNTLNRRRAAFSVNWVGDDVVFNGHPSLDTYRHKSQVVGRSIVSDRFPLVRGEGR